MTPERWRQVEELYHAAQEHGSSVLAGADPELRGEVEKLLAQEGSLLDHPAWEMLQPRPGARLGHYEIVSKLGQGGMGEVYRAKDTKLGREVAIKVLPHHLAGDPERLARFEREAKVLAALNHPNIAAIYGVEERAIVMELVEGETLKGPLPVETALNYARQIAEALEAAHDKGITHRDLKPANVKVTPQGLVKVLDFGLAAMTPTGAGSGDPTNSPTLTVHATEAGAIMGSPAYMSPEQASGRAVDKRADVWSFGVVLWELLTGKRLFGGETASHTLTNVLSAEIDFSQLPPGTPAPVRGLLRRCLDRDARRRLRDIGEARVTLESPRQAELATPPSPSRAGWLWPTVAGLLLAMLAVGYVAYRRATAETRVLRMSVLPPEKAIADIVAVSPDGRRIVFVGALEGQNELWIRELDSLSARPLEGTENATYPFWSPDSGAIGFFEGGKLKRIAVAGGPVLTLCDALSGRGGSWNQNGVIVFSPSIGTGIYRVAAAGGEATPVTEVSYASGENAHRMPWFLPDGHHFLYTARNNDPERDTINIADLDSKERRKVQTASSNASYSPPGYLLFLRGATLMAQPFDASSAQTKGEPLAIVEQVRFDSLNRTGRFSVSRNGVLAYASGSMTIGFTGGSVGRAQLTWFDRSGKVTGTVGQPGAISWPSISPDGRSVVFDRVDQNGQSNIWLYDQARRTESRFTFDSASSAYPIWSPDGSHIAYSSAHPIGAVVFLKPVGGAGDGEILDPSTTPARPTDWSRDGRYVIAQVLDPKRNSDVWVMPQFGDRKAFPYLHADYNEQFGKLSPGGKWLAYTSNETKRDEVYVQTFPSPGGKWQVSTNGGTRPVWSRNGKELFFIDPGRKVMAVEVRGGAKFEAGIPKTLFATRFAVGGSTWFDVSDDGRFLIPNEVEEPSTSPISVVINWTAGLKR